MSMLDKAAAYVILGLRYYAMLRPGRMAQYAAQGPSSIGTWLAEVRQLAGSYLNMLHQHRPTAQAIAREGDRYVEGVVAKVLTQLSADSTELGQVARQHPTWLRSALRAAWEEAKHLAHTTVRR